MIPAGPVPLRMDSANTEEDEDDPRAPGITRMRPVIVGFARREGGRSDRHRRTRTTDPAAAEAMQSSSSPKATCTPRFPGA